MQQFYHELEKHPFTLLRDEDITRYVSPNIKLVNETLTEKIIPAGITINRYLTDNYPKIYGLIKKIFNLFLGKKIQKQKYKYFSGFRTQAVFERYKTYHLIVLKRDE